jgi:hypothetical protein
MQARRFYVAYTLCVLGGAATVAVWPNLVALNIGVQVLNTMMLPLVLGLLIALAIKALPPARRLRGWYLWLVVIIVATTSILGVYTGISGAGLLD